MGFFFSSAIFNFLFYVALAVGSAVVFRPSTRPRNAKPKGLGDFQFPTASETRFNPIVWGTCRLSGPNVTWYDDLSTKALNFPGGLNLGFRYDIGIQFSICQGPIDEILSVWNGDDRILTGNFTDLSVMSFDDQKLYGGKKGTGGLQFEAIVHSGSATQVADPYLSTFTTQQENGVTPAYRGTCYVCPTLQDPNVAFYVGNSTNIRPWAFEVRRIPNGLGVSTAVAELNDGNDANPANVIYEILTDDDWGLNTDVIFIDTASFSGVAVTLASEANGFSFVLDSPLDAWELIQLVLDQIDGFLVFNQSTSKYQLKLARDDYVLASLDSIDDANSTLQDFDRGTWEETSNNVRVKYNSRTKEYKETFAPAPDIANVRIQGDTNVPATNEYPGCKDDDLAAVLASRDLRELSYPLAKIVVVVDRSFWEVQQNDVFRFSNTYLGIVDMAVRVDQIDFGPLSGGDGGITLSLVEDIFISFAASFGRVPITGWITPTDGVEAFLSGQQLAFECPRGIVVRDPLTVGSLLSKFLVLGRQSTAANTFDLRYADAVGSPSSTLVTDQNSSVFTLIGQLTAALTTKSGYPLTSLLLNSTPDTQTAIINAFSDAGSAATLGSNLTNLVLIDDELILVQSVEVSATEVQLNNVYRGALDTVQADHAINAQVFVVSNASVISLATIVETNNVDVKLVPISATGVEVSEAEVTTISFTMDKRIRRPQPVSLITIESVEWPTTDVDLEGDDSGDSFNIAHQFDRRDYTAGDGFGDEIAQYNTDNPNTGVSATLTCELRYDPDGADTLIQNESISGASFSVLRNDLLAALNGVVPTEEFELTVLASHTDGAEVLTGRQTLTQRYTTTTELEGDFEFGAVSKDTDSPFTYTVDFSGTHTFRLFSSLANGDVLTSINGAAFQITIPQGSLSGVKAGLSIGDTIDVKHDSTVFSIALQHLEMEAPTGGTDGFAILQP